MNDMNLNPENVEEDPLISPEDKTIVQSLGDDDTVFVWTMEVDLMRTLLQDSDTEPNPELMKFGDDGEIYSFYGFVPVESLPIDIEHAVN